MVNLDSIAIFTFQDPPKTMVYEYLSTIFLSILPSNLFIYGMDHFSSAVLFLGT